MTDSDRIGFGEISLRFWPKVDPIDARININILDLDSIFLSKRSYL
jgi:hypothetical protein